MASPTMEPTIGPAIQAWLGGVECIPETDGLEAAFWGARDVGIAKVEVLLGVVALDVFLLVVIVLDDDEVLVAAMFVGRRYTIVAIWPLVDVYFNVEYESRWQNSRAGSKSEILDMPPLGLGPCVLMQALQESTASMKAELGAHS